MLLVLAKPRKAHPGSFCTGGHARAMDTPITPPLWADVAGSGDFDSESSFLSSLHSAQFCQRIHNLHRPLRNLVIA